MVEDLYDLLTADHFLDVAVDGTQGILLPDKELPGLPGKKFGDKNHGGYGKEHDNGQNPGGIQQVPRNHYQCDGRGNKLGKRLREHLPQCIDVAGIAGHDVAGGVTVEVTDGKPLHFGKQLIPNSLLGTLCYLNTQIVVQECTQNTHYEQTAQFYEESKQGAIVRRTGGYHGQNKFVHQRAQSPAAGSLCNRSRQNADKYQNQNGKIGLQIAKKPQQRLLGRFGFAGKTAGSDRRHYCSLPFC